jgi:hypothetical protein
MKKDLKLINNEIATLANKANATELENIRLFKRRAVELSENSLIRNSYRSSVDLQLNSEEGPSLFIESLPSEEAFRSLLLTFRHFWAKKENCYFLCILNIIDRYVPETRQFISELRSLWHQALFRSTHIIIDGSELKPNELFDLWINAEYFHNDSSKKQELDRLIARLGAVGSPDFAKFLLIGSVCECCKAILRLNDEFKKLDI